MRRMGLSQARPSQAPDGPLRPCQRLLERVLDAAPGDDAGAAPSEPGLLGRRAFGPGHRGRAEDGLGAGQASLPRPGHDGGRRRPGVDRPSGSGVPPPGQGTAETLPEGRVPGHALLLHLGCGGRRAVRRDARASEQRGDQRRPPACGPSVGDRLRRGGIGAGALPDRGRDGTRERREDPEPTGASCVPAEHAHRRAEPVRPRQGAGRRSGPLAATSTPSSCAPSTPTDRVPA